MAGRDAQNRPTVDTLLIPSAIAVAARASVTPGA